MSCHKSVTHLVFKLKHNDHKIQVNPVLYSHHSDEDVTDITHLLQDVGIFLLEVCCKEEDLRVIAESLDAMFDVFGEDHLDPIVRDIQMVDRLNSLLPTLKKQVM